MSGETRTVVSFAGHARAEDVGDLGQATAALDRAFALVREGVGAEALLLTGAAAGADGLAAERWEAGGFGPVTRVHPFVGDGDDAGRGTADAWLDGTGAAREGLHPHLEQTRWLVAHADLLLALWNGKPARGPGGTADAVQLALDAGVPVLWVSAADGELRLLDPRPIGAHRSLREVVAALSAPVPTAAALRAALATRAVPQVDEAMSPSRLDGNLWRSYALFRRLFGGAAPASEPVPDPPADLAVQPGFRQLSTVYARVDEAATRFSAVHRSEQVILIVLAIVAAAVGASPALFPAIKIVAVATELLLALTAFLVWRYANRAKRHERWSEVRHFAEELRVARAAWALGMRGGRGARTVPGTAPPSGRFDGGRRAAWARWALGELVAGQRAYHRRAAAVDHRIAHRLHLLENAAFALLLAVLVLFILAYAVAHAIDAELPHWAAGVVLMTGAVVPALGAAAMALEAKLGFHEQASRSGRLAARLDQVGADTAADSRVIAEEAIEALRAETSVWREGASRRGLFRGG